MSLDLVYSNSNRDMWLDSISSRDDVFITSHCASHVLGDTSCKMTKSTESIVYRIHENHHKDLHPSSTTLVNISRQIYLLLPDIDALAIPEDAAGEYRLVQKMKRIFERVGNFPVPVDTAGRVIERAQQFDIVWEHDKSLQVAESLLIVIQALSAQNFDFARRMIKWASE